MMRRTPLARAPFQRKKSAENIPSNVAQSLTALEQAAIIKIVKMRPKTAPISTEFKGSFPKSHPVRSEPYRRAVAAMPCVICGMVGYGQAAHGSAGKGMGIKASDLELFCLCADRPGVRGCHSLLDQGAMFTKAVRHQLESAWAADTQRRIHAMGLWPKGIPYPHDQQPERPC
jgi:hypothetical protein